MANSNGIERTTRESTPLPGTVGPPGHGGPHVRPSDVDRLLQGTQPRAVTAETALRCDLISEGTLLHEGPFGTAKVVKIDENYVATLDHENRSEPFQKDVVRFSTFTFIPNK